MLKAVPNMLLSNAAVVAIVGQRVKPVHEMQGQALPFVVFTVISVDRWESRDGLAGLAVGICQVDCYSDDYSESASLADAVKIAMAHNTGTHNGEVVRAVKNITGPEDIPATPGGGTEIPVYGKRLEFEVTYQEATS